MSDVVAVAIAGGISTVSVALIGGLATVFGATWRETRAQALERVARENDLRYERALALSNALYERTIYNGEREQGMLATARVAFAAVLRPGEQPVADFVTREVARVLRTRVVSGAGSPVEQFSDDLFGYLRGDLTLAQIDKLRPADGAYVTYEEQ